MSVESITEKKVADKADSTVENAGGSVSQFFDTTGQTDTKELAEKVLKRILSAQPKTAPKALDLTQNQSAMLRRLFFLKESGREIKMTDLSVMLGCTKSAISQAVSKLERTGLVRRKWSKGDRRRILVGLTQKGVAIVEDFNRETVEFIKKKLEKMDAEEIRVFIRIFEKCMDDD